MALRRLDPDAVAIRHVELADVFDAVNHGLVAFGRYRGAPRGSAVH